ncbi:MAG: phytoene desaturase [Pseudomonadota bacterium]
MLKSSDPQSQQPHAVVIGSGFGGLSGALRLLAKGYRVTVLEALDAPGGRAYVFRQDGFTFDAGPTVITAPFLFDELWELFDRRFSDDVDMCAISPFYRLRFADGSIFEMTGDREQMRDEVAKFRPSDVAGFDKFMAKSEELVRVGFLDLSQQPFSTLADMAKVLPTMVRLGSYRSVYQDVARYFKDERLRIAFSFSPLLVGGNPFSTTAIYNLVGFLQEKWGVHFAMGGTGSIINAMVKLFKQQNGQIVFNAKVEEITTDGSRATGVRLADGRQITADIVVSNADAAVTYTKLLKNAPRKRWRDRNVEKCRYSMSLFVWYFGTNKQYPDIAHHEILLGERYRELLTDIFDHKHLADDFSLYLHRPTATDSSLAPDGCDAFYVLSPVPHLESGTDWDVEAPKYRDKLARALEATVLPGLTDHIASEHWMSPNDFRDRLNSYKGAAFGMEPQLMQSAWFRPHNKSEDIENLYLVGAGTHPGAGLPGVISSAKVLEKLVPNVATTR